MELAEEIMMQASVLPLLGQPEAEPKREFKVAAPLDVGTLFKDQSVAKLVNW